MNVRTTDRALTSSPRDLARTAAPRHLHPPVQAVILAAGMGTRLGRNTPKPLTRLHDGRTIQRRQLDALREAFGDDTDITVVVGFCSDLLMAASPDVRFAYNPHYASTNTSKSLWRGLSNSRDGGVLWMNGDVVFDPAVLEHVMSWVRADESFICVDTNTVADEEIKYTLDADGCIRELSKTVIGGLGEAVGINYVSSSDKAALIAHLDACGEQDYFERAIETAIHLEGLRFRPLDISAFSAVEVDFEVDLERAVSPVLDNALRHAASRVVVSAGPTESGVLLRVSNDGPGVAAENAERLFEPGWRAASSDGHDGAGLGLALARRLVDAAGGVLRVEDTPRGVTFAFDLPAG